MPFLTGSKKPVEREIPRLPGISIPFSRTEGSFTVHTLIRPPMTASICFKKKRSLGNGKWSSRGVKVFRYKIEVPWQAFMVRMNRAGAITDTFIWFMKKKPEDVYEEVYAPPLPNIYPSGHICNGTIRVDFEDPPHVKVRKAFEAFWTTPFTEETYPENDGFNPSCWQFEKGRYHIEYGYLQYIFEYWEEHDRNHGKKSWIEKYGSCEKFPWETFRVLNPAHPDKGEYVKTVSEAMDYALSFIPMKHS